MPARISCFASVCVRVSQMHFTEFEFTLYVCGSNYCYSYSHYGMNECFKYYAQKANFGLSESKWSENLFSIYINMYVCMYVSSSRYWRNCLMFCFCCFTLSPFSLFSSPQWETTTIKTATRTTNNKTNENYKELFFPWVPEATA